MLVSILVLNHNQGRWICEALDSIAAQDYADKELIILDDGSDDNSCNIIEDWMSRNWPQAVFLKNKLKTGNISLNMNRMLFHAKGDYIAINAADDRMKPRRISTQVACIKTWGDVVLVFGGAELIDEDSVSLTETIQPFKNGFAGDLVPFLLGQNCVPTCTTLFRRDVAIRIGGFDESLYLEDYDMWLRLASEGTSISTSKIIADYRRVLKSSVSMGNTEKMHSSAEESLIKYCSRIHLKGANRAIAVRSLLNILARSLVNQTQHNMKLLKAIFNTANLVESLVAVSMIMPISLKLRNRLHSRFMVIHRYIYSNCRGVPSSLLSRADFWRSPGYM
jgi:alpha-1,3-rhamnosyltransferase